jgi:hypothetical protein
VDKEKLKSMFWDYDVNYSGEDLAAKEKHKPRNSAR